MTEKSTLKKSATLAAAGLVDALSYLALGHVFVANVTGNSVFLGFAFAHAQGFVWLGRGAQ